MPNNSKPPPPGKVNEEFLTFWRREDGAAYKFTIEEWADLSCRFSGNGHSGCFAAPIQRHGGPCVPCWARALLRLHEAKGG